jgi:ADP-heptose:LPS heptosyltransferase
VRRRPVLLVLRALGVGDVLTAVPALRALATSFPEHRRLLACPGTLAPLLGLVSLGAGRPAVHELVDASPLQALPATLTQVAVAVNLHGRGPQSHRLLLALAPERLVAFAHPDVPESRDGPRWLAGEHEVRRWCRMLQESGIDCEPGALEIERPALAETWLSERALGATLLHPGAASPARRWPVERWAAVARAQGDAGRAVSLTGSAGEVALAEEVASRAGLRRDSVLAGRTGLRELAVAVGAAGRVVCGDTGVGHLATALGTPSVVLFGPVPPHEWGPPATERHRVLWKGRRGDPHARRPDHGLLQIAVGDVLAELDLLERSCAPRGAEQRALSRAGDAGRAPARR